MGIFSEWQPQYEQHGLVTFPVHIDGKDKKPYGGSWPSVGRPGSRALAERFRDCNAFGLNLKRERLTVLDVDSPKERDLIEAMRDFGPSPFVVRSGSGNFQAYYRSRGERRQIRAIPSRPIDILSGAGAYVVAPPSLGTSGRYEIIEGSLEDLQSLPAMAASVDEVKGASVSKIEEGERNDRLFAACMKEARKCTMEGDLIAFAMDYAEATCVEPLPAAEVIRTARSAWGYELRGENRFGRGHTVSLSNDLVHALAADAPDALALFLKLKAEHFGRPEFIMANAMADDTLKWTLPRFRKARDRLVAEGLIVCTHKGGMKPTDPPRYRMGQKGT